jgi:hypothetical protein
VQGTPAAQSISWTRSGVSIAIDNVFVCCLAIIIFINIYRSSKTRPSFNENLCLYNTKSYLPSNVRLDTPLVDVPAALVALQT